MLPNDTSIFTSKCSEISIGKDLPNIEICLLPLPLSPTYVFANRGGNICTVELYSAKSMFTVIALFRNHLESISLILLFCLIIDSGSNSISQRRNQIQIQSPTSQHCQFLITLFLPTATTCVYQLLKTHCFEEVILKLNVKVYVASYTCFRGTMTKALYILENKFIFGITC